MFSDTYCDRIEELFKSGSAEQRNTIAGCVLIASCEGDLDEKERAGIKLLEDAIGFTAAQSVEEEDGGGARAGASKKEGLAAIARRIKATHRKAERAGDRAWKATLRRLGVGKGSATTFTKGARKRQATGR